MKYRTSSFKKDRQKAVFLYVGAILAASALTGCASDRSVANPLVSTLEAFLPGHTDVSKRAAAAPYASIDFSAGRANGLLILSEQAPGLTFWQSSRSETIVLDNGYLQSTNGLKDDLLMTRLTDVSARHSIVPWSDGLGNVMHYNLLRTWRTDDGKLNGSSAAATMTCDANTRPVKLPLATLPLIQCSEKLAWRNGKNTQSTYWIDPTTRRIWAADTVAWPGGPRWSWQVARPWW